MKLKDIKLAHSLNRELASCRAKINSLNRLGAKGSRVVQIDMGDYKVEISVNEFPDKNYLHLDEINGAIREVLSNQERSIVEALKTIGVEVGDE